MYVGVEKLNFSKCLGSGLHGLQSTAVRLVHDFFWTSPSEHCRRTDCQDSVQSSPRLQDGRTGLCRTLLEGSDPHDCGLVVGEDPDITFLNYFAVLQGVFHSLLPYTPAPTVFPSMGPSVAGFAGVC